MHTCHLTPCVNTYMFCFHPQRRQSSLTHPEINTISCHSTFTHFAVLLQYISGIVAVPQTHQTDTSEWTWKMYYFIHPKPSSGKQFEIWGGFFGRSGHSVAGSCFMKANQSGGFRLFIYPQKSLWYVESFWLGKQWGVIHVLSLMHGSLPKIIYWHCQSHYSDNYGNDV